MADAPSDISRRKSDHIEIVLGQDVGFAALTTEFERIRFVHTALPELDLDAINLGASLFGHPLKAPVLISSMTGGPSHAETINRHLAEAAEDLGIAIAIGSQRIALEDEGDCGITKELRKIAPSVPLIGNLGAAQIRGDEGVDLARKAIEMIEADGLFIHLNPLQEAIQTGGDRDWCGVLKSIEKLCHAGLSIAVKEVGFGLSADIVRQLIDAGVCVIDVAGAGGTNWARVEGRRGRTGHALAEAFTEWGIPTAKAVHDARLMAPKATIIASGGIRNGVEAAKAIRLGADIVGQAAGSLEAATKSTDTVIDHFKQLIEGLRITCFVTGSADLDQLRLTKLEAQT